MARSDEPKLHKLSPKQRAAIYAQLDKEAGLKARLFAVLEPRILERDAPAPVTQWRFGAGLILLGIFLLQFCFFLPNDDRRWPFFGMGWLVVLVGAWFVDRAKKKLNCIGAQKAN